MGNYNLKSGVYRCQNCYSILKISISPSLPESSLILECKCSLSNITIKNFLSELTKASKSKIFCFECSTKEEKKLLFCYDCNHIYCSKCINKKHNKHKFITLMKLDYYCIFHQKETFCAFCRECEINLCKKCLEGKKHLNHDIIEFNKIMMNKTERNFLKDKLNLAQEKISFNTNFVQAFCKKMKNKNEKEKIIKLEKDNKAQNKNIIEVIQFFAYFYDNSRFKNYNIIHNFVENVNLNVNKFKFSDSNIKMENSVNEIIKYLNEDFIVVNNIYIYNEENEIKNTNSNKQQQDPMWDLDNEIMTRPTMKNINNFDLNFYDDKNDNNDDLELNNKINKEKNKYNDNFIDEGIKKKINKINNNKVNIKNDKNDYKRPRGKAIFIPSKIIEQKIKDKNEKEDEDGPELEEKNEEIKHQEKENKIEEEIKSKEENKVEEEIEGKEKIKNDENINDNKYKNFFSINRFRNQYNSAINLMMVNGYRKRKIYKIEINFN